MIDKIASYDYVLPEELIAQTPADPRDSSRLMIVDRSTGARRGAIFRDIARELVEGDLLVMNDTRVMRARAIGRRVPGGGRAEILLLRQRSPREWEAMVRPGRKLLPGASVDFDGTKVEIAEKLPEGLRVVRFAEGEDVERFLALHGEMPLPPYITSRESDDERYQTVYSDASKTRSAAAPTAGLHFTKDLLDEIASRGVRFARVTLDVGLGTFRPVEVEDARDHVMHSEACEISRDAADAINAARRDGRRVIAVGTTAVRTIESFADERGEVSSGRRETRLFIRPPYRFRAVDAMITNFHLPKSTLLMLVCAFAGHRGTMDAYRAAVDERYRFFSFGDAMFIR